MEITTQVEKIEQEIKSMDVQVGQAIAAIRDEQSCDIAANIARECADQSDIIEAQLGPSRKAAQASYEQIRDKIVELKKPYLTWRAAITKAVADWRAKVKAEIDAANRRAIEAAEKEAREKAEREAIRLEKKGEPEMAAVVRDNADCFTPPLQEAPRNKGIVDKVTWNIHIDETQKWKLIQFLVGQGSVNANLIDLDAGALKKLAQMRHEEMKNWPGVRVFPVTTSEIRRDRRIA